MYRLKAAIESRWSSIISGALVLAVAISVARLERFPEWDEAVFLTQSGGFNGIEARPAAMVASREMGTPTLIRFVRLVADTLANTRLLWIVVSLALLVMACMMIARHAKVPASLLIFGFGVYWVSITFVSSFYGYFIAAVLTLMAAACYLSLRADGRQQVPWGIALGACLSLALWFRQIEGLLVAACLLGHAAVASPRAFWRQRWRGMGAAAISGLVLFVVPWTLDSRARYGSVGDRISGGANQNFERGIFNNIGEYWSVLMGHSAHYGSLGDPPEWATVIVATLLVVTFTIGLFGVVSRDSDTEALSPDGVRIGTTSVIWTVGIALSAFFVFIIGTIRERYLLIGLLFLGAGVLVGLWRLIQAVKTDSRLTAALLGCLAALWAVPNVVVTGAYENGRFDNGAEIQHYAQALHRLAAGRECVGVSRFSAPTIQFGSGCRTRASTSPGDASDLAEDSREPGRLVFLWWPKGSVDALELELGEWNEMPRAPEGKERVVVLWSDDR